MHSAWSLQVPQYFRTMVPMTASIDSVQPACEGNPYEMLLSVVGGEPFVMQSAVALNLPRYDIVGSDGPALSYWIVWDITGRASRASPSARSSTRTGPSRASTTATGTSRG